VGSVPVKDIGEYHDSHYVGANLVVAAAGNVDHDRVVELAERHCKVAAGSVNGAEPPPAAAEPRLQFHEKQTEQYHLCLGAPGIPRGDERRFELRVLDTILGGSTSSRLFQEVREKRGLAYAVYSFTSHFVDSGQIGVYVGTRPDNVREAMDVIGTELRKIVEEPVDADELERAKENVKGRLVLSLESTLTRMNRIGSSMLMDVPLLSLDEMVTAIDSVTVEDVTELAAELFAPDRLSAGGVGGDQEAFRGAVEAVNPALVAAA